MDQEYSITVLRGPAKRGWPAMGSGGMPPRGNKLFVKSTFCHYFSSNTLLIVAWFNGFAYLIEEHVVY